MTVGHLILKLLIFIGRVQVLRFDFQKFRILEILDFHPCIQYVESDLDLYTVSQSIILVAFIQLLMRSSLPINLLLLTAQLVES